MAIDEPIHSKWASLGWERGVTPNQLGNQWPLGYPVTDRVVWRVANPKVDQYIAWNLFENGAIVTTKDVTEVASIASIAPDKVAWMVHKAADIAVHKWPNNIGLFPDVQITNVSGWEPGFFASTSRAVTFQLHGFRDNGLVLPDTNFHLSFALRFSLSTDPQTFTDPWFRSLQVELIPDSLRLELDGGVGELVADVGKLLGLWSPDDVRQSIVNAFKQNVDLKPFSVTDATPITPENQVQLIIIDVITTEQGGLGFLVSPEPPVSGLQGNWFYYVQPLVDNFVNTF